MKQSLTSFRLKLVLAFCAFCLLWEGVAKLLFPAMLFILGFACLAVFGVFEQWGDPVRLIAGALAAIGFGFYFVQNLPFFAWPTRNAVERRAERDGHLPAGTLRAAHDQPAANTNPQSQILWQAHQQNMRVQSQNIRPQFPHAIWAVRDRWALRILGLFALGTGIVLAGGQAPMRLENALYVGILSGTGDLVQTEAWLNPPPYSKLPPVFLTGAPRDTIRALPGSQFVVRVSGAKRAPQLLQNGHKPARLQRLSKGVYEGRAQVDGKNELSLRRGAKGTWHFGQQTDQAPHIQFQNEPQANAHDALQFSLLAEDDFGITKIELLIEADMGANPAGNFAQTDRILLSLPLGKQIESKQEIDVTQHVLAGLPVQIRLQATDGAGQQSQSALFALTLPQKLFIQPLAKAIQEQRILIMRDPQKYTFAERAHEQTGKENVFLIEGNALFTETPKARLAHAPAKIRRAAALMGAVMRAPQSGIEDPLVWMGLSYVRGRLFTAKSQFDLRGLDDEMWQIALRAEGGELESAAAALKLAQRALQRSLLLSDPPPVVERLSQKYKMAVERYMQALAKAALQNGQSPSEGGAGASAMNADQLEEMLKALQALAETGANMDARRMLKALSALLENMKIQLASGGAGGEQSDMMSQAMRKALEELGDMLGQQRELLDQMQQQQNQDQDSAQNGPKTKGGAGKQSGALSNQQNQLQGQLNELGKSGTIQDSQAQETLSAAEQAMKEATAALAEGAGETGLAAGQEAFTQLRAGAETLANELLQHQQGQNGQNARDPFGRPSNTGSQSGEAVNVPDVVDPQKARKILQEIRRRASEQKRERDELNYLERLLERF